MMQNAQRDTLRQFVVENFLFGQVDNLSDQDSFLEKGIIDSTGILELISFLERHYRIKIADEDLIEQNFDSIDKLMAFLSRKLRVSKD
ncbi:MAG: acyl carrier protein [Rhodospirillales bacterium]